jgi:hypothetical protein
MEKIDKKRMVILAAGVLLLLGMALPSAFGGEKSLSGKEVFTQKCLKCHKPEKFTTQHHDRRGWEQILSRMELNTCNLTAAEANVVAEYLIEEYGD